MKKSFINKTMLTISFLVSAVAVVSVCTSCQGNNSPEDDNISVINMESISETVTESTVSTEDIIPPVTEIPSDTVTTLLSYSSEEYAIPETEVSTVAETSAESSTTHIISVPTGTQKPVTKPPVTSYDVWPPVTQRQIDQTIPTNGHNDREITTTTIAPTAGSYVGDSPNSAFYQERIAIAGDSIAYGFDAYGYIPASHNIAKESVSMWNIDYFTFNTGMGLVDSVAYINPSILYMSMGMNDVNNSTAEEFAERYKNTIYDIRNRCPDINIIVAGITPVSEDSDFVNNNTIMSFNTALEEMVTAIDSNHVYYFDAYSIVADPETNDLRPECTGGDGIHLVSSCYYDFLDELFEMLDDTPVKENIEKVEQNNVAQ
ncbi:MAG: hypothetical protein K2L10_08800 [Ruminococcus sp.]|nr:hypothetical protein [Ruminococcus sp.]